MSEEFGRLTALLEALLFVSERPLPLKELLARDGRPPGRG